MPGTMAASASGELTPRTSILEETIEFVWDVGPTASFTQSTMNDRLEAIFSSVSRAIERNDRDLLTWLADRLTSLSARLLRNVDVSPAVYFAVYARALGDVTYALSSNTAALLSVNAHISRTKHILPLISALNESSSSMTAGQLAERLSLKPNNLSHVLKAASDAGVVSCIVVGRNKYCALTGLGQAYLEEFARPIGRAVSSSLIDQYWKLAMQAPTDDRAIDAAITANPAYTEKGLRQLYTAVMDIDGQGVAISELRDALTSEKKWLVVFKDASALEEITGCTLACTKALRMQCEVAGTDENFVRFAPVQADAPVGLFAVPYRLFLNGDVRLRTEGARRDLPVHPASFERLKEASVSAHAAEPSAEAGAHASAEHRTWAESGVARR